MICQFKMLMQPIPDGEDIDKGPNPNLPFLPMDSQPETKRLQQNVIRGFAEHGHEVSFVEVHGETYMEVEAENSKEINEIIREVMQRNGCVIERYYGGVDGLFDQPDFGESDSDFGDFGFDSDPDPDFGLN